MAFKIITDSASDLPQWIIDQYGTMVIPTPVVIDGVDHRDRQDIFPGEFYDILRSGVDVKTYHINAAMFYDAFEPYAKEGGEYAYLYRAMAELSATLELKYCISVSPPVLPAPSAQPIWQRMTCWRSIPISSSPSSTPNVHPWASA